jgi:hypothetical protein
VPLGIAVGLALALALDRAAAPAGAQAGGRGVTLSAEQLRINQKISQQAVKRANRANSRLDKLTIGGRGPAGPPGPPGPAGPAGPGAGRAAYSAAVGAPAQTLLDLAGVTLSATCEAGSGGETALTIRAAVAQATTFVGTSTVDTTDPSAPAPTFVANFELPLSPGPASVLGAPVVAADGEFFRSVSNVLFVAPTRTVNIHLVAAADGVADRCSFNGVAVPA